MPKCFGRLDLHVLALILVTPFCGAYAGDSERVLHSFTGPSQDGSFPVSGLLKGKDGSIYGTAAFGGSYCLPEGCGVVFKLAPDGTETVLHDFRGVEGDDGANPEAGLIADKSGNLFGTTLNDGIGGTGGTIFKLAPDGTETILHSFTGFGDGIDGAAPVAALIVDKKGNLYGTTSQGGGGNCPGGCGTVFKLAPDGTESVLHAFNSFGGGDGGSPAAGLVMDRGGNLYGTTSAGGTSNDGTVFRLAPDGTDTVLHNFIGFNSSSDGGVPYATLIMGANGNLYGTTRMGGSTGQGTVFKLAPDGTETVLHNFTGGKDGRQPLTGVIADQSGDLFGTTAFGGHKDAGTIFRLAPDGTEKVLYSFTGKDDGSFPSAGVIADGKNKFKHLYCTTKAGGTHTDGVIFAFKP